MDESGMPAPPEPTSAATLLASGVTEVALDETPSTNAHALELLKSGAAPPHLTLVWARRQMKGRGRGGRVWQSPEGNVFFSMILRPQPDWGDLNQLPLVTSVATHAAIRPHVPPSRAVTIKWPNDVLIDGAKVSGTLIESHRLIRSSDAHRWSAEALVVGIGVNVAHFPAEGLLYPATSLREVGSAVERDQVIRDLAHALIQALELWRQRGFAPIRAAYLQSAHGLGERITIRTSLDLDESVSGVFEGIDEDGALLLRLADGTVRSLVVGDVFFGDPNSAKETP
ncbi:biotin--[acetyl-CoA-carboxylase] ligase [Piscinibacter sp. XHJ-5]|uniref:biotin--[acetyl-CoA-carboxylase] ligase n=1 Tax=Piscinibacter sp. XHJ-5 TaxID=3037797 RepID=UPI0024532B52|nr:biotin--[acetyl-CoA-carboxylase] ligase [Piscinibacter sp. XHJ-5]